MTKNTTTRSAASQDIAAGAAWDKDSDPQELRLLVNGVLRAVITRWSPKGQPHKTDWWAAEGIDGQERKSLGLFDFPGPACRAAAVFAAVALPPPDDLIEEYGEPLTGANDQSEKADIGQPPLANQLLDLLAQIVDTPLMKVRDPDAHDREIEIRLGSFLPELTEKAAGYLLEAGR